MTIKKLIEVSLPLDEINAASIREKSIRHGHPSTLHLWWARRPLAASRAVIFSSLVDDPSSHPEQFPTEEDQEKERERLFKIIRDLVVWENSNDQNILNAAREEIMKSTGGKPPEFLDPFAGGGAIPLEADRLGLNVHASDLNPVAVMINKAMLEIPALFANCPAVNPKSRQNIITADVLPHHQKEDCAAGLAEDVGYYAGRLKEEAYKKLSNLYPKITLPDKERTGVVEATVVGWIRAKTVRCPNPECGCDAPLVHSFVLSSKKGSEKYIEPIVDGKTIKFVTREGNTNLAGTVNKTGGRCIVCHNPIKLSYIREYFQNNEEKEMLMAIITEGKNTKNYVSPDHYSEIIIDDFEVSEILQTNIVDNKRDLKLLIYGSKKFIDIFSNRQLLFLTTLSSLLNNIREEIFNDAIKFNMDDNYITLENYGQGAFAYSQAIIVYLSFIIDKLADYNSKFCSWHNSREVIRNTFSLQAIKMTWDYVESNPFSNSSGCFDNAANWVVRVIKNLPAGKTNYVKLADARINQNFKNICISTDPPYYDNIFYADIADYFYVWMRLALREIYPSLFSTILTPKSQELVASKYRHNNDDALAKEYFEKGISTVLTQLFNYSSENIPLTIFYAYKQSQIDTSGEYTKKSSSGWETILSAIIEAGFTISGTWPMRTEMPNRSIGNGKNALASSIVLVCRKRQNEAEIISQRDFLNILREELSQAVTMLQKSNVTPVDMVQSAIGPGMAVFSRFKKVLRADGTSLTVREALENINHEFDAFTSGLTSNFGPESSFCIKIYTLYGFNPINYGSIESLAKVRNISIDKLIAKKIIKSTKGTIQLLDRNEISHNISLNEDNIWLITQHLTWLLSKKGIDGCANAIRELNKLRVEQAKALVYYLFNFADQKVTFWSQEAYAYNSLIKAWPDIQLKSTNIFYKTRNILV
jgi:putative DNA methylase